MSRIAPTFARLRSQHRTALIPFVTAGFPYADVTPALMHAMVEGGADLIELGIPFSDPSADGPAIQRASDFALSHGVGLCTVLDMVRAFRRDDTTTPVVLMGYANPVERYDQVHRTADAPSSAFVQACTDAGVDGVLIVDYPPQECVAFAHALRNNGIDPIFLLAPTSTEARIRTIGQIAGGYVYYVSLKGVTGSSTLDADAVARALPRIREHVHVPIAVGFGIREPASARNIAHVADGVVIGSRIIECIASQPREGVCDAARTFLTEVRAAMDAPT
ncbi:tryptophan synthase subunit alpha [Candidatus Symbiobacter mobilis]|uniref:Tryptophan synthase alpha chain n=1 Tax=Candidatus Symbiobacter mobilis CR TaxID=946483 RepID=U5NE58_9BURK|nr:tryptophan synthase subunit alpha [Candidatus Symbiobacter mobilis]AGX88513.1 tryptophan synthase subunit alpha [Candidatus Symbiobacter mobilis CR]